MELSQQYKMKQDFLKKLKDPSLIDRLPERAKIELSFGGFANGITPKFQTPNSKLHFDVYIKSDITTKGSCLCCLNQALQLLHQEP